jgi:hypothetical protein
MAERYIYLDLPDRNETVAVKLDDEGVVVDVWDNEKADIIATTYEFYTDMGIKIEPLDI